MTPAWATRAKRLMREKKINQLDIAPILGITTRGGVGHYFVGRSEPSLKQLTSLALFLDVSPQYLLFGGNNRNMLNKTLLQHCFKAVYNLPDHPKIHLSDDQSTQLVIHLYEEAIQNTDMKVMTDEKVLSIANLILAV